MVKFNHRIIPHKECLISIYNNYYVGAIKYTKYYMRQTASFYNHSKVASRYV